MPQPHSAYFAGSLRMSTFRLFRALWRMFGRMNGELQAFKAAGGGTDAEPTAGARGVGLLPQDLDLQPNRPLLEISGVDALWTFCLRPDALEPADFVPVWKDDAESPPGGAPSPLHDLVRAVLRGRDGGRVSCCHRDDILGVNEAGEPLEALETGGTGGAKCSSVQHARALLLACHLHIKRNQRHKFGYRATWREFTMECLRRVTAVLHSHGVEISHKAGLAVRGAGSGSEGDRSRVQTVCRDVLRRAGPALSLLIRFGRAIMNRLSMADRSGATGGGAAAGGEGGLSAAARRSAASRHGGGFDPRQHPSQFTGGGSGGRRHGQVPSLRSIRDGTLGSSSGKSSPSGSGRVDLSTIGTKPNSPGSKSSHPVQSSQLKWTKYVYDRKQKTKAYTVNIQMERMEPSKGGRAGKRGKPLFIRHEVRVPPDATVGDMRKIIAKDASWRVTRVRLRKSAGDATPIPVDFDIVEISAVGILANLRAELLLSPAQDTAVDGEEEETEPDEGNKASSGAGDGAGAAGSGSLLGPSAAGGTGDEAPPAEQMLRALEWRQRPAQPTLLSRKTGGDAIDNIQAKRVREFGIGTMHGTAVQDRALRSDAGESVSAGGWVTLGVDASSAAHAVPVDAWSPHAGMDETDARLAFAGVLSEHPAACSAIVALLTLADADSDVSECVVADATGTPRPRGALQLAGARLGALAWRLLSLFPLPDAILKMLRKGKCPAFQFNEEVAKHGGLLVGSEPAADEKEGSLASAVASIPSGAKPIKQLACSEEKGPEQWSRLWGTGEGAGFTPSLRLLLGLQALEVRMLEAAREKEKEAEDGGGKDGKAAAGNPADSGKGTKGKPSGSPARVDVGAAAVLGITDVVAKAGSKEGSSSS